MNKKVILAILSVMIILVASGIGIYTGFRKSNSEKVLKIYFLNKTSTDIVTEEREVEGEGDKLLDALIEEILAGPDSGKNKPVVGKNTTVTSKKKTDTYLTIDAHRGSLTALAVHRHAPIIASGSAKQLIKNIKLAKKILAIILPHKFKKVILYQFKLKLV